MAESQANWEYVIRKVSDEEDQHELSGSRIGRVQFYNDNAQNYDLDMQAHKYIGPALTANAIHDYLKGDITKSILDVGGGTGLVVEQLRKLGDYKNVDGLDPAESLLEQAQSKGYYRKIFPIYFYNGCGMEENSYDVLCVCGAMVPGHIKSESLREMCRIVRPGGCVVIVMSAGHMVEHEELRNTRPTIQALVSERKWEVVKDFSVDNYFAGKQGQVFVFRKL